LGEIAEALRRARIERIRTGGSEPGPSARAAASAPARLPDRGPHSVPQDEAERVIGASPAPWRHEAIALEEAEPLGIPRSKKGFWRGRAVLLEKPGPAARCFRHFALRVREELERRETGTLLVTSPLRGEGKTITACNLALALASMAPGRRIALVDLDLRSHSVSTVMGFVAKVGVEDVLAGRASLDIACIRTDVASLDLLPAADSHPDAHELLATAELPALLRELARRYETVVCDAPPVLPVPDVPLILPHVGAWLAVARAGRTRPSTVSDMLDLLPGQKLIGTFLNCAPAPRHADQYGPYSGDESEANAPDAS
jgi:Mrp family chromosome partitioning ATPase